MAVSFQKFSLCVRPRLPQLDLSATITNGNKATVKTGFGPRILMLRRLSRSTASVVCALPLGPQCDSVC